MPIDPIARAVNKALRGQLVKEPKPPRAFNPRGPAVLGIGQDIDTIADRPDQLPDDLFVTGATSLVEKMVYWGLLKELGEPIQGGVVIWDFQKSLLGGRQLPGGAVADFVVYADRPQPLLIRVQTFQFHMSQGELTNAYDFEQFNTLWDAEFEVVDLYDQYFVWDESGGEARANVRDALNGIQRPNPNAMGQVFDAS